MEKELRVLMIVEIIGRPKSYLKENLDGIIKKIKEEEGVSIIDTKIAEAKQIQDKNLYSSFAEIEINVKDDLTLFRVIFTYLPSHVEIINPSELRMRNFDLSAICNEIVKTLHRYDELAKVLAYQKQILEKQLEEKSGKKISKGKKQKSKKKKSNS